MTEKERLENLWRTIKDCKGYTPKFEEMYALIKQEFRVASAKTPPKYKNYAWNLQQTLKLADNLKYQVNKNTNDFKRDYNEFISDFSNDVFEQSGFSSPQDI